jgi:tetratricopeptide (TPR) repeat protein
MKSKHLILVLTLMLNVLVFSQKNQIKAAEKEFNNGNSQDAAAILKGVEYMVFNADDSDKVQFYFLYGNVLLNLVEKNIDSSKNLSLAAKSYSELIEAEKISGVMKYTNQVKLSIIDIKKKLELSALSDSKEGKFVESANKLYDAYLLDKKDTLDLYFSAISFMNGKDYISALKSYEELKNLNYLGKGVNYQAINVKTQAVEVFDSLEKRDAALKSGSYSNPKNEIISSRRGEIYKNIALIYIQEGKSDKAKKAISDARRKNPEDLSLAITEANLYLNTNELDMYKRLIAPILEKNPTNTDLIFNLGVINVNAKNFTEAEFMFKKVIAIDSKYVNAYLSLASMILDNERVLMDEMNKLGTSSADMKIYTGLKVKSDNLFKSSLPHLQKALSIDSENVDAKNMLLSVYNALEMTAEYKDLKTKI